MIAGIGIGIPGAVGAWVTRVVVVQRRPRRSTRGWIVRLHIAAMMILGLVLLEQRVVFVTVTAVASRRRAVINSPRTELVLLVKVMYRGRGERGLGLRVKGGICDRVRHGACPTEVDDVADRNRAGCNKCQTESDQHAFPANVMRDRDLQDYHSKNDGGRADPALRRRPIRKGVAAGLLLVLLILAVLVCVLSFSLPLSHVYSDTNPSAEPQNHHKHVEGRKGIDIAESARTGKRRNCYQVNQEGYRQPALRKYNLKLAMIDTVIN